MISRIKLAAQRVDGAPRAPAARLLLREATYPLSPITRQFRRKPAIQRASAPVTVLMLPGFFAHPVTMRYLSTRLEMAGHTVKRWGIGANLGPTEERLARVEDRLQQICAKGGQEVVLLGWSLGGLFARELAKRRPELVAKVITMGSPFSGDPRANNAWRLYQFVTGRRVDDPPVKANLAEKPPVETVAMWSPRDGIVAPRSACGWPGERDRAVALRCTHMGFSYHAEAVEAVLAELDRSD